MTKSIALFVGIALLVVLVLFSMTFTVRYNEVAIRTRFGQTTPESIIREAGLHFRLPLFADRITTIDTRLQLRETALETLLTADGQQVLARAFVMWQIDSAEGSDGPLRFNNHHPGGIDDANQWIGNQFTTALRSGIGRYTFDELIGAQSRLPAAEKAILDELQGVTSRGIVPKSVGISQLVLPPKTTTAVLRRMEATRSYLSEAERYKGDAEASGIESRAYAQAEKIRNFANQLADEIRTEGNKDAAKYIAMMGEEPELAIFLTWLDALQNSLSEQTTFIVPTYDAPMHLLRFDTPTDSKGVPQPRARRQQTDPDTPAVAGQDSSAAPSLSAGGQ